MDRYRGAYLSPDEQKDDEMLDVSGRNIDTR